MALAFKVDSLDGLSETVAALYTEKDGAFTLAIDGLPDDLGEGGKALIAAERKAARAAEAATKKWKALGKTPDEIAEILEAQDALEEAAAKKRGDFDSLRKQDKEKFDAERKTWDEERTSLQASERKAIIENSLISALASAGFTENGLDVLPKIVAHRINIDTEDGERVISILQDDGATPLAGSAKNGTATFADLAKELTTKYPEFATSSHKPGGAMPRGGQQSKNAKAIARADFDAMSHTARAAHFKNGGSVVD